MRTDRTIFLSVLAVLSLGAAVVGAGCSGGDSTGSGGGSGGSGGSGQGGNGGTAQGGNGGTGGDDIGFIDAGNNDGSLNEDSACVSQSSEATLVKKPVDIIVVIDNSGSMTEEIVGVQNNINKNFAQILEMSGLDYRVIMVARHGSATSGQSVCIEQPLSGIPMGGCSPPPAQPVNAARFFHYSVEVASHDSLCKILSTYSIQDEFALAPNGWKEWLRPDSFKTFIELTDDGISCSYGGTSYSDADTVAAGLTVADKWDAALLAMDPAMFGTIDNRNYRFYSIVAMGYNDPPSKPWEPTDPVIATKCPTAAGPGTGYQGLSNLTGGLKFPLCDTSSYDAVFQGIAEGVVAGAQVACDFLIPDPPMGETVDLNSVVVDYTPGDGSAPQQFKQVADASVCAAGMFYIDKAANTIHLCPDTCGVVKQDDAAKISVRFACDAGGAN